MSKVEKRESESDIVRQICEHLKENDFFFWRQNNIPVFGKNNAGVMTWRSLPKFCRKGVPDIMVLWDGKFIGLEVKKAGKVQSPEQVLFEKDIQENGGYYFVVTSVKDVINSLLSI